jgi:hypothetical protein
MSLFFIKAGQIPTLVFDLNQPRPTPEAIEPEIYIIIIGQNPWGSTPEYAMGLG